MHSRLTGSQSKLSRSSSQNTRSGVLPMARRMTEEQKAHHREYQKLWRQRNPERHRQLLQDHWARHPEQVVQIRLRWFEKHYQTWDEKKTKAKCRWVARLAVRADVIQKSNTCQVCGEHCTTELHHTDYTKPLHVIQLCRSCHKSADKARREQLGLVRQWYPHRLLTKGDYAYIRQLMSTGKWSQVQLGRLLGLSNCTISKILSNPDRKPRSSSPERTLPDLPEGA